ncbi:hypothetical protein TCAL_04000 [Tigriopus californicus]|uniref:Peroxisomal membrane protein PEX13 n=1 Tax=Tigriopus californicus TaxID=6832 RepID=A0A553NFE1_TIGCA|nr:peroxisomal membrane protein PEX13-like [Tigriopus californicus]TRY64150.1 hypothetical protein TCAL_04000 [Tigriopus californicus]|eukprot:TCALIF_04000-PA protein Name:"Similar to Pex13 Peroxisomal membrane protein PEX13 (Mus musculus)" AED:0.04 eAED:0.04 QI:0/-1/0/1/-1/1/1/0/328
MDNLGGDGGGAPPPLPPRPSGRFQARPFYSGNSYSYGGMYGMNSGPGGYGAGYGYNSIPPYGGYGYNQRDFEGDTPEFVQFAEENTRPAFETIQSIVQSFSSISMMFESTYHALYSSFRAILGVIEQFSKMKLKLSEILSSLALIRFLRKMYMRLFTNSASGHSDLGLDLEWGEAGCTSSPSGPDKPRNWPVMLYLGLVLASPYFIWKMLKNQEKQTKPESSPPWSQGVGEHYLAKAQYAYIAQNSNDLTITKEEEIRIAPKGAQSTVRGWLLAANKSGQVGLVPANYVKVIGKRLAAESNPDIIRHSPPSPMGESDFDRLFPQGPSS